VKSRVAIRPRVGLVIGVILAAAMSSVTPASAAPHGAGGAHGPDVWLTTGDEASLLAHQPPDAVGDWVDGAPTITIDPSQRFQRMTGLGASITDSSAHLIAASPHRDAIMRELFDPKRGLGLSFLRQPVGASDFVAGDAYTYDDVPRGQTDYRLKHFSIGHDRAEILPLLRQALALNPNLRIMATPWSPPAWMKTSQSLVGGRFIDDPRVYDAYGDYLVRFVRDYRRAGVPIDALTVQNEPQNRNPSGYPGMDLRDPEEARLIATVGRKLAEAGLSTKLLGYDHNWSLHPNDGGPPDDPANPEYAKSLVANPTAHKYLDGIAYHCYSGDPESQSQLHDAFPNTDIYFTECSGTQSGDPATTFPDTLHWHTRFLTVGAVRNWAKTVVTWNLALDPAGGPHNGGCDTCVGVVTIDPATGKATPTADYYVLGHATKFLRPGAVRIGSTVDGTIQDVAFRNPDGSIVLIVNNDNWDPGTATFNVRLGSRAFSYQLPNGAVTTMIFH
jgi:glucosylceramidase